LKITGNGQELSFSGGVITSLSLFNHPVSVNLKKENATS